MAFTKTTITVSEVIDAIEKNGYKQVKGTWVGNDPITGEIVGCAIGQGAINAGLDYSDLTRELNKIHQPRKDLATLGNLIMYLNDRRGRTIPEIVAHVREKFAAQLDTPLSVYKTR
jgi:hypothetical protein